MHPETGPIGFNLLVVALLLFANGFFVATEFALVSVRKTRISQLSKEGADGFVLGTSALFEKDSSYKKIMGELRQEVKS